MKVMRVFNFADGFTLVLGSQLRRIFSIRVATIAFDETTILDFCVFVVVVLASSVTTQKIS